MYNVIRKQLDTEIQLRKVTYNYMWHIKNRQHRNRYGNDSDKKGQLDDDVILLQLPESLSLLFSCAN